MLQQPVTPILVKVIDKTTQERTVADVLLEALGLTGVFVLLALVTGLVAGSLFIAWTRLRRETSDENRHTRLGLDAGSVLRSS